MTNPPFTLMIDVYVSLHFVYSLYSCVRLLFSFFSLKGQDVVDEVSKSCSVCMINKPWCRKNMHSVFKVFFCSNVYFEDKPSEVVGKYGDPSFNVGPVFQNKFSVI